MPGAPSPPVADLFVSDYGGDDPAAAADRYDTWLARFCAPDTDGLRQKRDRMAEDAFAFLRGAFFRWGWHCRGLDPGLRKAPVVLAVGDLHLENFGTWRDAEGRLIWGVNDVDEAAPLPFTSDLVRLSASALLEAERKPDALHLEPDEIIERILDGYRAGIETGGRPFVLEGEHPVLRDLAAVSGAAAAAAWAELAAKPKSRPLAEGADGMPAKLLRQRLPAGVTALRWFRRRAGLGSLGRPRFLVLAEWQGGLVAREAKAAVPSAATPTATKSSANAEKLLNRAVRAADPLFSFKDGWAVRRLAPDARKIEITDIERTADQRRLLRAMGREVANLHLGTDGAAAAIRVALTEFGAGSGWLHAAAATAAHAVIADHHAFAAR